MKLILSMLLCLFCNVSGLVAKETQQMVVTIDDLPANSIHRDTETWQNINRGILTALKAYKVPAAGFVNESKLYDDSDVLDPIRVDLLKDWLEMGHTLGNHGYAHLDLHKVVVDNYLEDILQGEQVLTGLWKENGSSQRQKFFRHPFLHTGTSLKTRSRVNKFLSKHDYQVAPVTIDNQEYIFARAYERAVSDSVLQGRIADAYLTYMTSMIAYYRQQSEALLGYQLPQILLIHANQLNSDTLHVLLQRTMEMGYEFVGLNSALEDPAYDSADEYVGNGGITWIHRWALTQGKRDILATEPSVADFVLQAYR